MKADIKEKWVAALRSGKYMQGKGSLRSSGDAFCCLGVLCDLHDATGWSYDRDRPCYYYENGAEAFPPYRVSRWAGEAAIEDKLVSIKGIYRTLSEHNDLGATFEQIATAIEEQL